MGLFELPEIHLPARRKIFAVVSKFPGLHFREVQRRTGLGTGTSEYHAGVLEKAGIVKIEKRLLGLRLYPREISEGDSAVLSLLHHGSYRSALLFLLENPRAPQARLNS